MPSQQRILTRNPRLEAYLDVIESTSGILLVGFLWSHMLFVSTIILGRDIFNGLSEFFDAYFLSYLGIPVIVMVGLIHFMVAGRRIPTSFRDQRIIWQHAKRLRHTDTWTWIFQVITGMAILVLAAIHVWAIVIGWPIRAETSAGRILDFWWFYLVLLALGEYHAGMGIYRIFVKWGWFPRKPVGYVLKIITLIIVALGLGAIWVFLKLGGAA